MRGRPLFITNTESLEIFGDRLSVGEGLIFINNFQYCHNGPLLCAELIFSSVIELNYWLYHLQAPYGLQEKFQNLDMALCLSKARTPCVKSMLFQKKSV